MKSRVEGVQRSKFHLYKDKCILDKDSFYEWALSNKSFLNLFEVYKNNNFSRKLAPSVDRIDSSKGYAIDNMEFVTMSENSRRGAINRNVHKGTI